jgi:Arc/MetJ-type ribon-helix-helix transcriptional regulator
MKPPRKGAMQEKGGRSPPGQDPFSAIRLPPKLTAAIDTWAEVNGLASRSEAIHRLLELGLAASQPMRRRNLETASKALELAAREIDRLIDPSTPDEERKTRKRRLLRGPKEFQDLRGDVSRRKN